MNNSGHVVLPWMVSRYSYDYIYNYSYNYSYSYRYNYSYDYRYNYILLAMLLPHPSARSDLQKTRTLKKRVFGGY